MTPAWTHQTRSVRMIQDSIAEGHRRILYTGPTGSGKTRIITDLIQEWLNEGLRTVLYTNRKMLVEQTAGVMEKNGIVHGVRAAGWDANLGRDVQVSSIQTEHARVLKSGQWPLHDAQRVLIDEAHLQKGETAQEILARHLADGAAYVGLTATPLGLKELYDVLLVGSRMQELRDCGALVLANHYGPDEPDTRHIKKQASGEYSENDVRKVIMTSTIFARVLEWYKKLNPDQRPSILFGPDVAGSIWFAEEFVKAGISAAHIDGSECWLNGHLYASNRNIRHDILEGSKDGSIKVVCNRFVLREGIDCPWLEHGIFATVFGSLLTDLQSGGRLLRTFPGKTHATIQDHGGNYWRHGSLNADRHWELSYTANIASSIREEKLRNKQEPEPFTCPQCRAVRIWRGPKCQACGFEVHDPSKKSRPVVQVDGTIKEHKGDIFKPHRVKEQPDTQKIWLQCYHRCRRSKRTFRQAEGLFFYENHYYPPRTMKMMPVNELDWFERVDRVPTERLRA